MYNLELLIGTVLLLTASNLSVEKDDNLISISTDLALKSMKDAQLAGADVSELVGSFNVALDLIEQANKSKFESCSSYEDCNEKAGKLFVKIANDAHLLKEQAEAASTFQRLMNLSVYAPVTAFVTSVIGYSSFKAWKSRQIKRLLEMEIREKEK